MKVIFLDIDGVLNVRSQERDEFGSLFHEEFVNNLKHIIEETDAKIVISSTWRFSGLNTMQQMWKKRNLPGEVIDITPFKSEKEKECKNIWDNLPFKERCERGWEIEDWLDINKPEKYVILDDDNDFLDHQIFNFVQTFDDWHHIDNIEGYGLTKECTNRAITILNS